MALRASFTSYPSFTNRLRASFTSYPLVYKPFETSLVCAPVRVQGDSHDTHKRTGLLSMQCVTFNPKPTSSCYNTRLSIRRTTRSGCPHARTSPSFVVTSASALACAPTRCRYPVRYGTSLRLTKFPVCHAERGAHTECAADDVAKGDWQKILEEERFPRHCSTGENAKRDDEHVCHRMLQAKSHKG